MHATSSFPGTAYLGINVGRNGWPPGRVAVDLDVGAVAKHLLVAAADGPGTVLAFRPRVSCRQKFGCCETARVFPTGLLNLRRQL